MHSGLICSKRQSKIPPHIRHPLKSKSKTPHIRHFCLKSKTVSAVSTRPQVSRLWVSSAAARAWSWASHPQAGQAGAVGARPPGDLNFLSTISLLSLLLNSVPSLIRSLPLMGRLSGESVMKVWRRGRCHRLIRPVRITSERFSGGPIRHLFPPAVRARPRASSHWAGAAVRASVCPLLWAESSATT